MAVARVLRRSWAVLDGICPATRPWEYLSKRGANRRVKIELLKDIKKLGKTGGVVMVRPGRMRNYLYPKKEAVYAMYNAKVTVRERKAKEILKPSKEDLIRKQLSRIVERLTTSTLEIRRPLREGGDKNVSITADIVCKFVRERLKIIMSESLLDMPKALESSGEFKIPLKFTYQGESDLTLKVNIVDVSETEKEE